ncbi:MAG: alanine--glyoxylate aminotransferase family protein [Candidatus Omnitrophota bacterium]
MQKNYLMTPGPTPVPPEVLTAMARPIIHHRTPQYEKIFKEVNDNLKYVFRTTNDILTFASSGTGAMEAAVVNLLSRSDKVLVISGGKFGQRWAEICNTYSLDVKIIDVPCGDSVDPGEVKAYLDKCPDIKVVFTTYCETSTGAVTDIQRISQILKNTQAIIVVDAISAFAGMELLTDEWGIDVVVVGSQKGLMIPPGLSFCSVSKKAWERVSTSKLPKYYFDFKRAKKALDKNTTAYTPAISLTVALNEALKIIKTEGLENALLRHKMLARACRRAMNTLNLQIFAKNPADVVTSVKVPEGIDGAKLVKTMREKYGVSIAGGQEELKGKIFRIAHMGYMDKFDLVVAVSCLEIVLSELGYKIEFGQGVGALEEVFKEVQK